MVQLQEASYCVTPVGGWIKLYVSRLVEPFHSHSETNTRHAGSADHGWTLLPHNKTGHDQPIT